VSKDKRYTRKLLKRYRAQQALEKAEDAGPSGPVRLAKRWVEHGRELDKMTKGVMWE
jgi:hypothetical protein